MKPFASFALGLAVGAGIALAVMSTRIPRTSGLPVEQAAFPHHSGKSAEQPSAPPRRSDVPQSAPSPGQNLEAALQEIREAGMVVIPQELLALYTPSFTSARISPNIQHTFRLDSREIAVLNDARLHFERALMDAANRNLEVVEANDSLLVFKTTTLPEDRKRLIDTMQTEVLRGLDEDSAGLFAYLDLGKALGPSTAGLKNATIRIRRIPGAPDFQVTVSEGSTTRITTMTRDLLSQVHPNLKDYLPPTTQP